MEGTEDIQDLIRSHRNEELERLLAADSSCLKTGTEIGISHLQFAAYCRNMAAADIIKRYQPEINFFEAVSLGEYDIVVRHLLDEKFSIDSFSADGFTGLGLAAYFGHKELVQILIDNGANVNLPSNNNFKVAPLHSACAIQDLEITGILLENGANPNARQMQGITPLHSAAHNGNLPLVELLVQYKAELDAVTEGGKTPSEMALEMGFLKVEKFLNDSLYNRHS